MLDLCHCNTLEEWRQEQSGVAAGHQGGLGRWRGDDLRFSCYFINGIFLGKHTANLESMENKIK